jgi:predicted phosphodiesterase
MPRTSAVPYPSLGRAQSITATRAERVTRIRIHSDLHLEFQDWHPPPVHADVVVLAGDIGTGLDGLRWARRVFPHSEVVYVAGNHEYYGFEIAALQTRLREVARELGVHFLDGDEAVVDGTRFLGATLWSAFDFELAETPVELAMEYARRSMPDYRVIRTKTGAALTPRDTQRAHFAHVRWLTNKLAEPFSGPTVVVTHHLPHRNSVHRKYADSPLNPTFVTHLPALVCPPVDLWIHGHTHESADYRAQGTRVVCNPRGYLPDEPNEDFDPTLIVESDHKSTLKG